MDSKIFAALCFVSLTLVLSHQAAAFSSRGPFVKEAGICSTAVSTNGYKCQEYEVTTDDGYKLTVLRIPAGRNGSAASNRPPVLLQHGVLVDGLTWLINNPEESLAMILADNGFDVWVSNIRGTRFSRDHIHLRPSDSEYWNWTWDDLVNHDLPSVIQLIFKETGQKTHYIGHSMGTLIALASFSEGKQIDKIKSAVLLSPIAYLSHMNTALGYVVTRAFIGEISRIFGLAEFNPRGEAVGKLVKALCASAGIDCYDFLTIVTGKNCCLNSSTVDIFLKHEPQSTSTKNMVHMAQTARNGILAKYDYGNSIFNKKHYGQPKPPVYNLTKIPHDLPIFMSYGGEDALSDQKDVATLLDALKLHDVDKLHVQYVKDYAHADFIIGVTAKDVIYNQIIAFFKKLN